MKINESAVFTSDTHFRHANVLKFDDSPYWSDTAKLAYRKTLDVHLTDSERRALKTKEKVILQRDVTRRDEQIIANWNEVVTSNEQLVFHLGDFTFSNDVNLVASILDRLNGRIILIKGNHEKPVMNNREIRERFTLITDYLQVKMGEQRICLFHYPIHEWDQAHRGAWHLHGHTHTKDDYTPEMKRCNVGTMLWDYKPVTYKQLTSFMKDKVNKGHH